MSDFPRVRIVFGKERYRDYDDAVALCRRLGKRPANDYLRSGEGHNIKHIFRASDPRIAGRVWDRVRSWNSARIFIDDRPATAAEFRDLRQEALRRRKRWWTAAIVVLVGIGIGMYFVI